MEHKREYSTEMLYVYWQRWIIDRAWTFILNAGSKSRHINKYNNRWWIIFYLAKLQNSRIVIIATVIYNVPLSVPYVVARLGVGGEIISAHSVIFWVNRKRPWTNESLNENVWKVGTWPRGLQRKIIITKGGWGNKTLNKMCACARVCVCVFVSVYIGSLCV